MNAFELNKLPGAWKSCTMEKTVCCRKVPIQYERPIADEPLTVADIQSGDWVVTFIPPQYKPRFDVEFTIPKTEELARELFNNRYEEYVQKLRAFYEGKMLERDRITLLPYYEGLKLLERLYGDWLDVTEFQVVQPYRNSNAISQQVVIDKAEARMRKAHPNWVITIPRGKDGEVDFVLLEQMAIRSEVLAARGE